MRKIVWIFLALIVLFGGMFGFLYFKVGLREHINLYLYLNTVSDQNEKEGKRDMYFLKTDIRADGGTLAFISHTGVFVWSDYGLKYFRIDTKTKFIDFENCTGLPLNDINTDNKRSLLRVNNESYENWRDKAKPGTQVFVVYDKEVVNKGSKLFRVADALVANTEFNLLTFTICFPKLSNFN